MKYYLLALSAIIVLCFPRPAVAQNKGEPLAKKEFFYTIGGGVIGTALSVAWWLTDPLKPDQNFRDLAITGFSVGVIIGFIYGFNQLGSDAIPQYSPEDDFRQPDEFLDDELYGLSSVKPILPEHFSTRIPLDHDVERFALNFSKKF